MTDVRRTKFWIGLLTISAGIQLFVIVMITAFEAGKYTLGKAVVHMLAVLIVCIGILVVRKSTEPRSSV